jgi:hypothetical protein
MGAIYSTAKIVAKYHYLIPLVDSGNNIQQQLNDCEQPDLLNRPCYLFHSVPRLHPIHWSESRLSTHLFGAKEAVGFIDDSLMIELIELREDFYNILT